MQNLALTCVQHRLKLVQYITFELPLLMLCIEGYIVPVVLHLSGVLFSILQYLQRDLLQKLNPCSLVEVPRCLGLEMNVMFIFGIVSPISSSFVVSNWSTLNCLSPGALVP